MRIVTRVRIGHFDYDSPGAGEHDAEAGVWRYAIALRLQPLVDRGDGVDAQPDAEELAAIGRMVGDLSHVGTLELPESAGGAEPSTADVLAAVGQWVGTRQATALQAVGRELVPAYLREVE